MFFILFVFLREQLTEDLNFDNYKEKFDTLLHIEELQMQKDIRNYDMKGVTFKQDTADRRFLVLEVQTYQWLGGGGNYPRMCLPADDQDKDGFKLARRFQVSLS